MPTKTKIIKIRCNDEDYNAIKKLSSNYNSMSHAIRIALSQFNDNYARNKIELTERVYQYYKSNDAKLGWTASNINQIAHRINFLNNENLLTHKIIYDECVPVLKDLLSHISYIRDNLTMLMNDIIK